MIVDAIFYGQSLTRLVKITADRVIGCSIIHKYSEDILLYQEVLSGVEAHREIPVYIVGILLPCILDDSATTPWRGNHRRLHHSIE